MKKRQWFRTNIHTNVREPITREEVAEVVTKYLPVAGQRVAERISAVEHTPNQYHFVHGDFTYRYLEVGS